MTARQQTGMAQERLLMALDRHHIMAKAELGLKRTCVDCDARFYDLNHTPPTCPKCGTIQPTHISRLKRRDDGLVDDKDKALSSDEHENDVDLTEDDADDVMADDDTLDDDDISSDIEVSTDKDDRDDN